MEIYPCEHKVKCDFSGCKNLATYTLVKSRILRRDLSFCDECLCEIYQCISKVKAPKALKSHFKLNKRLADYEK